MSPEDLIISGLLRGIPCGRKTEGGKVAWRNTTHSQERGSFRKLFTEAKAVNHKTNLGVGLGGEKVQGGRPKESRHAWKITGELTVWTESSSIIDFVRRDPPRSKNKEICSSGSSDVETH